MNTRRCKNNWPQINAELPTSFLDVHFGGIFVLYADPFEKMGIRVLA